MSTVGYINVSLEIWGSILLLIIAFCMLVGKHLRTRENKLFLYLILCDCAILLSDAAAWLFKGHMDPVSYWGVRLSNFISFALSYVLLTTFTRYLTCYIGAYTTVSRWPLRLIQGMCAVALVLIVISQFNHMFYIIDEHNVYHRQEWFWVTQAGGILGMLVNVGLLCRYRKAINRLERIALWSYIVLPVLAMTIQIFFYGIALLNLATTISIVLIFLLFHLQQARQIQAKERELAQARITVMLSQIQPHFLYNALTAIKQLCDSDPAQAKEAVVEFSLYLRGNLDALTSHERIPFEREMEQVRNYLSLEKKRFGDMLRVEYQIDATGFTLPPLTVQPIVENAVRHGVTKKEKGGTVAIASEETPDAFVVTVSDDGVGFSPQSKTDGENHVGLTNVKNRLASMCGGRLTLDSAPERGTRVTITIPKERMPDAADCGRRRTPRASRLDRNDARRDAGSGRRRLP